MLAGVPREVGGFELPPGVALRCAEELARGDASAGWCLSIAATSGLPAAYLPADSRAELFGDPLEIPPGSGPRAARPGLSTAASSCRAGGPTAAGSPTRPFLRRLHRRQRPRAELDRNPAGTSWRSSTRGTRSACAARAATMRSPTSCSCPRPACPRCSPDRLSTARCTASRSSGTSRSRSARPAWKRARDDGRVRRARGAEDGAGSAVRSLSARPRRRRSPRPSLAARRAGAVLRGDRSSLGRGPAEGAGPRRAPQRPPPGGDARRSHLGRPRPVDVRPRGRGCDLRRVPLQRRFRDAHTATAHFQVNAASRELPGRILLGQEADTATL